MKLKGRVAIVTGASRGIGRSIALAFAKEGASVTVAARTTKNIEKISGTIYETAEEIERLGGKVLPIKADVRREKDIENVVTRTLERFKRIDILVNNAAVNRPNLLVNMPLKHWDLVIEVKLKGTAACIKAVLPVMMKQRYGHIINLSSCAATEIIEPFTGLAYDVSKAGIERLTWGLAAEVKKYHIAVNALVPSNTETEGWSLLNPEIDKSRWQRPEMWGKYAVLVAARAPKVFTGKMLSEEKLKKEFGQVD